MFKVLIATRRSNQAVISVLSLFHKKGVLKLNYLICPSFR